MKQFTLSVLLPVLWFFGLLFCAGCQNEVQYNEAEIQATTEKVREAYFLRDFEGGAALGSRWAKRVPNAFELRAWTVQNLARDEQVEAAIIEAEKMLKAEVENPWSWFAMAAALNWHRERGKEALEASEKAFNAKPNHPDFIWLRAETIRRQDSNSAAIAFIDEQISKMENPAELLTVKAVAQYNLSLDKNRKRDQAKVAKALTTFAQARELDTLNLNAHFLAGANLVQIRRFEEAYSLLKKAIV